jgi:hypothetical protein
MTAPTTGNGAGRAFREFARKEIEPEAHRCDQEERIPENVIAALASHGYLGLAIPERWGGSGASATEFGLLCEALGAVSLSVHGLVNVQNMVAQAIARWGSAPLRNAWLPELASGRRLAALAATEVHAGSDLASVRTRAERSEDGYRLSGEKRWITTGQIADVFLVLARCDDAPTAFLVERDTPGVAIEPIRGMLGCRGYMLAEVRFDDCRVASDRRVGGVGTGLSHVLAVALDAGRYALAWGCVGAADDCLKASLRHTSARIQGDRALRDHQLVQSQIARMAVEVKAARLLCAHAGSLRGARAPGAISETWAAKYLATRTLSRAALAAVQLHGAVGCGPQSRVACHLRDSRITEIVEGTTQIHELALAAFAYRGSV